MATFGQAFNSTRMTNLAEDRHKFEKQQAEMQNARIAKEDAYIQQGRDRTEALRTDEIAALAPRMAEAGQLAGPMPDGQDHQQVYKADGQAFGTQQEAEQAAGRSNLRSVRMQRLEDTYAKHGEVDKAQRYYDFAKQAREEGASDLLKAIQSSAPDIESIRGTKAGFVSREIPADALSAYDGQGKWRVPKGAAVQTYITKDDFGNEMLDHRVVRADGTEIVPSVNTAERFLLAKPGAQAEYQDKRAATKYALGKDERDFGLRKQEMDSRMELRAAQADAAEARASRVRMGGGGGGGGGSADTPKPGSFWTPKDDDKLESAFTRKDDLTGANDFDAQGFQFAKRLALAAAQQNGGDTASARAWAFEQDRKLQRMAGGDRDKLNQLRADHIKAASQPPAPPNPAPQPVPQAAPPQPQATAPRVRMAEPNAAPQFVPTSSNDAVTAIEKANFDKQQGQAAKLKAASERMSQAGQMLNMAQRSGDKRSIAMYQAELNAAQRAFEQLQGPQR